jgi:hypothetical protein
VETVGEDVQERIADSVRSAPSLTARTTTPRKKKVMKKMVVSKSMTNYQAYVEAVQDLSEIHMRTIAPDLVLDGMTVRVAVQKELPDFGDGMHAVISIVDEAIELPKFAVSIDIFTPDLVADLPTVIDVLVNLYRAKADDDEEE